MKVACLKAPGGLENIHIEDRDMPKPGPNQVLVRIHASSLNFHDLAVVSGRQPVDDRRIPMSDGAGEVVETGQSVTRFNAGDRVMSMFFPAWIAGRRDVYGFHEVPGEGVDGFAAQYVAVSEEALTRIPEEYSFREAATLPCAALTAWRALFVEYALKPGDWVLTQGTGGVSIFALQFAKAAGARVIATSSSEEKLVRLKDLGADHIINYTETLQWGKEAKAISGGKGVHTVVEIGGPGTIAQSIDACRPSGQISYIGVLTGLTGEVPLAGVLTKNLTISGITVGSRKHQDDMIAAIEASGVSPVLDRDFPLNELRAAFEHQISQQHFGKITLSI